MDATWIQRFEHTMNSMRTEEIEREIKNENRNLKYGKTQYVQSRSQTEWSDKERSENRTIEIKCNDTNESNYLYHKHYKHRSPLHSYNTYLEPLHYYEQEIKKEIKEDDDNEDDDNTLIEKCKIHKRIIENYKDDNIISLYPWQVECLDKLRKVHWSKGENFIYVAPTSGGKTLVSEIYIFEQLFKRSISWEIDSVKVFFAFPLNALINEKMSYFSKICKGTNIIVGSEIQGSDIILCTYERLNGFLNKKEVPENSIIIIDEMHILNECPRGIYIENIISKVLYLNRNNPTMKVITMSGTLNNLLLLKKWMNAILYVSEYRPQQIQEFYICNFKVYEKGNEGFIKKCELNTSGDIKVKEKYDNANDNGDDSNYITDTFLMSMKYKIRTFINQNKDVSHDSTTYALLHLSSESQQKFMNVLIFCRSKKICEQFANMIGKFLFSSHTNQILKEEKEEEKKRREKLSYQREMIIQQIENVDYLIGKNMEEMIRTGVAYYHSALNTKVKRILENAFKEKVLFLLTCTSSLAVGLNLFVDRVIISSPFVGNLFITETTYKQMIGRAARHRKGDAFILVDKSNEKKLLHMFKQNKTIIKSTMHNNMETLEKYSIELASLWDESFHFSTFLYLFSFSFFFYEIISNYEKEQKEHEKERENDTVHLDMDIHNKNNIFNNDTTINHHNNTYNNNNNNNRVLENEDPSVLKRSVLTTCPLENITEFHNFNDTNNNTTDWSLPSYKQISNNHKIEKDIYRKKEEEKEPEQIYDDTSKSVLIDLHKCTKEEIYFYKKKKDELHKLINYMIKHKCIGIKNNEFYLTTFGKSLCISNFSITTGVDLLNDMNSFNNILYLYNNMHICYIIAVPNINISSFIYSISFLRELITKYTDSHSQNVIFNVLEFNRERIHMLYVQKENHTQTSWTGFTNIIKDKTMENKHYKLYIAILLYMFLKKYSNKCICEVFKITQDVLQCILQKTLMHTHILITFFDQMGSWIMASILKKVVQQFNKRSKEVFNNFNNDFFTNQNTVATRNIFRKFSDHKT